MPEDQEFDEPQGMESEAAEGFAEPPDPAEGDDLDDGGEDPEETATGDPDGADIPVEDPDSEESLAAEDDAVIQCKCQIEEMLCQSECHATGMDAEALNGAGNIVGVGHGIADEAQCCGLGVEPGAPVLNVYVEEPVESAVLQATLVDGMGVQSAASDEVPINVVVTGLIEAQPFTKRYRPAPCGVSVAHIRVTAGTLGCLARARRKLGGCDKGKYGDRRRRRLILSNNHVLANSNRARCLDPILQPGPADGGKYPKDLIALLERWVNIRFGTGKVNYVDCATGWAWPKRVRRKLIYRNGTPPRLFKISSLTRIPRRGMTVGKVGRTTQLKTGQIVDTSWSGWINYGTAGRAFFRDQFIVKGPNFSAGGDSGSVIWTWNRRRNPVGLLFAGGGGLTIANKMWRVLRALDIRLDT